MAQQEGQRDGRIWQMSDCSKHEGDTCALWGAPREDRIQTTYNLEDKRQRGTLFLSPPVRPAAPATHLILACWHAEAGMNAGSSATRARPQSLEVGPRMRGV
jgi:hypothetical protein